MSEYSCEAAPDFSVSDLNWSVASRKPENAHHQKNAKIDAPPKLARVKKMTYVRTFTEEIVFLERRGKGQNTTSSCPYSY